MYIYICKCVCNCSGHPDLQCSIEMRYNWKLAPFLNIWTFVQMRKINHLPALCAYKRTNAICENYRDHTTLLLRVTAQSTIFILLIYNGSSAVMHTLFFLSSVQTGFGLHSIHKRACKMAIDGRLSIFALFVHGEYRME